MVRGNGEIGSSTASTSAVAASLVMGTGRVRLQDLEAVGEVWQRLDVAGPQRRLASGLATGKPAHLELPRVALRRRHIARAGALGRLRLWRETVSSPITMTAR